MCVGAAVGVLFGCFVCVMHCGVFAFVCVVCFLFLCCFWCLCCVIVLFFFFFYFYRFLSVRVFQIAVSSCKDKNIVFVCLQDHVGPSVSNGSVSCKHKTFFYVHQMLLG